MRDIRFTGEAGLSLVRFLAKAIRIDDERYFVRFEITEGVDENPVRRVFILIDCANWLWLSS